MMFQKKVDRVMNWLKEKNKAKSDNDTNIDFEKKDIMAIVFSAIIVFAPVFLVLIAIMILVSKI